MRCSAGSPIAAAANYGLIGTAKLAGLDPDAYLHCVITHINEHRLNKVAELLRRTVAAQLPRRPQGETETTASTLG